MQFHTHTTVSVREFDTPPSPLDMRPSNSGVWCPAENSEEEKRRSAWGEEFIEERNLRHVPNHAISESPVRVWVYLQR
jgi:hypothetical protein